MNVSMSSASVSGQRKFPVGAPAGFSQSQWKTRLLSVVFVLSVAAGQCDDGVFNVRSHGAKGDGSTLDTAAINQAITNCAGAGGGQVLFPPGRYLTGTLQLRSHITLHLEAGATLVGTTNLAEYLAFVPPEGVPEARFKRNWHRALILGDGLEDVSILGLGVIDGNRVFDSQGEERMRGPHTILLGNSRNLTIREVSVRDSANYAIMLEGCDQVEVNNVKITGGWDGVHFRGWPDRPCHNVQILNCQFYTGDDAIAGRYWENVLISGCIINSSCNGIRLIGPAQHLVVHDCLFYGPGVYPHRTSNRNNMLAGVCLQPGGWDNTTGVLDDVLLSDLTMRNVSTPFLFTLKPGNTAGRINVDRVSATGIYRAAASVESWAETSFTNVVFRDLTLAFAGGGKTDPAKTTVNAPGVDARSLPVWGFYARKVNSLTLDHVCLRLDQDDSRPVLLAEQVYDLNLDRFEFPTNSAVSQPLVFTNVANVTVDGRR
jgi:polygalacturonase